MKTILKKSLAMAVCVALCLTAFIGCLTVSATGTATAVISTANVANGTASTNLTVTISGSPNIVGARFDIVADATKLTLGTVADGANFDVETSTPATNTTRFVVTANDLSTGLASIEITLPYTIVNPTTAGTISVEFGEKLEVAEVGETLMTVTPTNGAVVVAAAHVHDFSGAWQTSSTQHWKVCEEDSAIGNLADHAFGDWTTDTAASCTAAGTKHRTCSVCGYVENGTIPANGHTPAAAVQENVVNATCVAAGSYDSVVYCSVCNAELSRETVNVPATGAHTAAPAVQENVVPATCGAAGSYDSVVYCSVCNTEISRETVNVPATGEHTWGDWVITAEGHSRTCSVCSTVDSAAHDGDPCSVCGYESTPVTPESVLDSSINISALAPQFNISETMNVYFRVAKATTTQNASYASCDMIITAQKYNSSLMLYTADPVHAELVSLTSKNNAAYYYNIATYELDLELTAYVACYNELGQEIAHSASITTVPANLLKGLYKSSPATEKDIANNTLITDTLNLGTVAQTYFASQKAGTHDLGSATPINDGWDQTYASASLGELADVTNLAWNPDSSVTSSTNNITLAADLSGAPVIKYSLLQATATGSHPLDYSKLTLEVSYTTLYTVSGTPALVTDTITGSDWAAYAQGKHLRYNFTKAAMYDSNKTVTFTLTYDGTEVSTVTYSLDSFIYNNHASASLGAISTAIGKFAASARAYFAADGKAV